MWEEWRRRNVSTRSRRAEGHSWSGGKNGYWPWTQANNCCLLEKLALDPDLGTSELKSCCPNKWKCLYSWCLCRGVSHSQRNSWHVWKTCPVPHKNSQLSFPPKPLAFPLCHLFWCFLCFASGEKNESAQDRPSLVRIRCTHLASKMENLGVCRGKKRKHHGTVTPSAEGKAALVGGGESNLRT